MTKTAQSSIPPASFTASGLQTKASLPEVRGISLPANRQPGAKAPGNTKSAYGWAKSPVCPALPSSTSTPTRAKKAARCCRRSLRRERSMSGLFAYAVRWRQIAWRRQGEQLAAREVARSRLTFASTGRGAPSSMVSADRRLSSACNRHLTTVCATDRSRCPQLVALGAKRTSTGDVNKRNLWVHVGDQYKTAPA